ncbi:MAG: hypothetical protein ACK559_04450 [bacterium]
MRPGSAPRKLRRTGQRRRDGIWQHSRRARLAEDGRPVRDRQDGIAARGDRTASLTASTSRVCPRTGLALLNK